MRYQLVLQFAAESVGNFDRLVNLEEKLMQELASVGEVDGHDFGESEFNIFVLTDDPVPAFEKAREYIEKQALPCGWRAAYREMTSNACVILWPPGQREFDIA